MFNGKAQWKLEDWDSGPEAKGPLWGLAQVLSSRRVAPVSCELEVSFRAAVSGTLGWKEQEPSCGVISKCSIVGPVCSLDGPSLYAPIPLPTCCLATRVISANPSARRGSRKGC